MRRDSIFFQLFKRSPEILFGLMPQPPINTAGYTFESIAVKETTFTIDGVFVPPNPSGDIVFAEVQFQPDKMLDERILSESAIYIYRNINTFHDWRVVIIYPTRSTEQESSKMPPELFESGRINRIYLDELGAISQLPTGSAMTVLTTKEGESAVTEARGMLERSIGSAESGAIMDMVVTIMAYKFNKLNQDEVAQMLGIELSEVRAFQDAINEGEQKGRQEGEQKGRQEAQQQARALVKRQLAKKLGSLSSGVQKRLDRLSIEQVESLGEAFLDFDSISDLKGWLSSVEAPTE